MMKLQKIAILFNFSILLFFITSCAAQQQQNNKVAIVIHGGAGTILPESMTDSLRIVYQNKLEEAITAGHEILKSGGSAMEAVQKSINIMENSPLFNSGKGAVFTHDEKNSLDASIMDGNTLNAGAIAGVTNVKNPINLAYEVMKNSPHVLLSGEGAEIFAKKQRLEIVNPQYFFTQNRYDALKRVKANDKSSFYDPNIKDSKYGTVGCVALDKNGNLAAGTSTGGMTNKKWGRIGDSPIIGAGTYANNKTCAVSSTGWGEYFIRGVIAYDISAQMEYANKSLEASTKNVIQKLQDLGGNGGVIALDKNGNISMEFNTAGMYRASIDVNQNLEVKMFKE